MKEPNFTPGKNSGPIQSQEEADKVSEYLISTAMRVVGISRIQARARISALMDSKLLNNLGKPDEQPFQIGVDVAMRIPQLVNEEMYSALLKAKDGLTKIVGLLKDDSIGGWDRCNYAVEDIGDVLSEINKVLES